MSKIGAKKVFLDTSFLDSLYKNDRPHHDNAVAYFSTWVKRKFIIYTSSVCIAEFLVYRDSLPREFDDQIHVQPFTSECAMLASKMFVTYSKLVRTEDGEKKPGFRDSIKDDFKIVATAAKIGCHAIAHDDVNSMSKFISDAQQNVEQCHKLNQIVIANDYNDGLAALEEPTLNLFDKTAAS